MTETKKNNHQKMTVDFVERMVALKTKYYDLLDEKQKSVLNDRIAAFEKYKFRAVVTNKQKFLLSKCYDEQRLLAKLRG